MRAVKSNQFEPPYAIEEHQHRFAAWAASSAASISPLCRFRVETGIEILETCGFNADYSDPNRLPDRGAIDKQHKEWRIAMIDSATRRKLPFTHGVAAKLIDCYLKSRFVCGSHHRHDRVACLHPPIDAQLLAELAARNVGGFAKQWRVFRDQRWSKYGSRTYQDVIDCIRCALSPGDPLWMIEKYWKGHQ